MGTSVCPLCPVLLTGCGLLTASEDAKVLLWGGLCCSTEAQDGEEVEEEEEDRGRSGGEAGGLVGFSFSIMVVKSPGNPCQCQTLPLSGPACTQSARQCVPVVSLYVCESN